MKNFFKDVHLEKYEAVFRNDSVVINIFEVLVIDQFPNLKLINYGDHIQININQYISVNSKQAFQKWLDIEINDIVEVEVFDTPLLENSNLNEITALIPVNGLISIPLSQVVRVAS